MPVPAVIDLSTLDPATGVRVQAPAGQTLFFGGSAGDLNGDGFEDYWFSALDGANDGALYVVFGTIDGLPLDIDLGALDGENGFRFSADPNGVGGGAYAGIAGADVNGDGIDDLVIANGAGPSTGAPDASPFVLFGHAGPWAAEVSAATLGSDEGFALLASDIATTAFIAGDLNDDGLADMVAIGALDGQVHVVYGRDGDIGDIDLANLAPGEGATFQTDGDGRNVSAASGDFNGDGLADLAIGAFSSAVGGALAGSVHVLFGSDQGFVSGPTGPIAAGEGFMLTGETDGQRLGVSVTFADLNGDGLDDLVTSGLTGDSRGEVYVVFGRAAGVPTNLAPSELDGADGFRIIGSAAGAFLGFGLSGGGDINGDGYEDLIISATRADFNGAEAGATYIVFGRKESFGPVLDLSTLDGMNGFRIEGALAGDGFGAAPRMVGDLNADGFDDLMVGGLDPNTNAPTGLYIIYGQASLKNFAGTPGADVFEGGTLGDTLFGLDSSDILNGRGGDDIIDGGDGKDVLYGDEGADTLAGGLGGDLLDGGIGVDQMAGGAGDDTYVVDDLNDQISEAANEGQDRVRSSVTFTLAANLENLQLTGSADINGSGNALGNQIDGNSGANNISGNDGADLIRGHGGDDTLRGDAGDDQLLGGDGTDDLRGGMGGDRIDGGAGRDILSGDDGNDIIDGGSDNDVVYGDGGADQLSGGDGDDILIGDDGNDVLSGGAGTDELRGGVGDDTYFVIAGDVAAEGGNEGVDTIRSAGDWVLGEDFERLVLDGAGDIDGTGNELANQITGNGGANILDGAAGNDNINGGLGADRIIGGTGNDILTGGGGIDSFVVRQESVYSSSAPQGRVLEVDTIADYQIGVDIIDLSAIASGDADGAFNLVSSFDGVAGRMVLKFAGGTTTLSLDVDGDARADYLLKINGNVTGDSGNWLL